MHWGTADQLVLVCAGVCWCVLVSEPSDMLAARAVEA
jgi:hypothetical protein